MKNVPVIELYTATHALADGNIFDLSKLFPKEVGGRGILIPTYCTKSVFKNYIELTPGAKQAGEIIEDRVWDLLGMAMRALIHAPIKQIKPKIPDKHILMLILDKHILYNPQPLIQTSIKNQETFNKYFNFDFYCLEGKKRNKTFHTCKVIFDGHCFTILEINEEKEFTFPLSPEEKKLFAERQGF